MNYRKTTFVVGLVLGLSCLAFVAYGMSRPVGAKPVQTAPVAPQTAVSPPTRAELLALVNAERAKYGVAPLTEDTRLDQSAQMKANDEVKYNYFGHISPADSPNAGKNSHDFIASTSIGCLDSSENLTENTHVNDAQHAVAAWINSPSHHAAMIDPKYTLTGFGIGNDQIVEHFCQQ